MAEKYAFKAVVRDFWTDNYRHRPYRGVFMSPRVDNKEINVCDRMRESFEELNISDGDEVEITIKKTSKRPFGDRRIVLKKPHTYGPETDAEMKKRLKNVKE